MELFSFYSRLYSLKELSYAGSAAAVKLPLGSMGLAYAQFGEAIYREQEAGLSYSFGLTPRVFVGAAAKGYSLKIDEFGSARALGVDVGVASVVHPGARLSILAKNVNRPGIGRTRIPLPTGISADCFKTRQVYVCQNRYRCRQCRKRFSLLSGTWLSNMKLPLPRFWLVLWSWTVQIPVRQACSLTKLSEVTIRLWYDEFRIPPENMPGGS